MADLTSGPVESAIEFTTEDESASDAGAEEDPDHIPGFGLEFDGMDAEHGDIAVILHEHRHPQDLLQVLAEGRILPLQVRGKDHLSRLWIDGTGRADPHRPHLFEGKIRLIDGIAHTAIDAIHHEFIAPFRLGAELGGGQQLELRGEDTRQDLGAAEIDTHDEILA